MAFACPRCGAGVAEDATFCPVCGAGRSNQEPNQPGDHPVSSTAMPPKGRRPIDFVAPRSPRQRVIALVAIAVVVAGATGYVVGREALKKELRDTIAGALETVDESTSEPLQREEPSSYRPRPEDFQLGVTTLEKNCFGSAGCNVTYRIDVSYFGQRLDPSDTWEVIYEVRGADDTIQNRFTLQGDQASQDKEELASTNSSSTELQAVVTQVLGPV